MEITINGATYVFRYSPAGTFTMGSPEKEKNRKQDERQHEVTITRGFWILETPVTQAFWKSVADGYLLSDRAPDLNNRAELEKLTTPELYSLLQKTLPGWEVDKNNRNRVMRVLEKHHDGDLEKTGREPRYRVLRLGVTWDRETLKKRIDERLDRRFEEGMSDEVRGLMDSGVSREFLDGLGLEYRYITRYLTSEIPDFEDMKEQLSLAIKRFARRQMTWFRRHKDVIWLDMSADPVLQGEEAIRAFLKSDPGGQDIG